MKEWGELLETKRTRSCCGWVRAGWRLSLTPGVTSLLWLSSYSHWTSPEALAHNRRRLTHVTVVLSLQSGAWNTSRRAVEETPSPSITAKTRRAVRTAAITVTVTAEARRHRWSATLCPDVLSRFRNTLMPVVLPLAVCLGIWISLYMQIQGLP